MENEENAILFLCVSGYLHYIHFVYQDFAKNQTSGLIHREKKVHVFTFCVAAQVKIEFGLMQSVISNQVVD